ncbi:glycosyltransferase family 4 protein, partial [bacterium]|nr:glycosyltransferase family 4 protein [bacterium]
EQATTTDTSDAGRTRTILIAGINTIRRKNLHQLAGLKPYGYRFVVLTADSMGRSRELTEALDNVELFVCHPWWFRLTSLYLLVRILLTRRIDLAEVYPYAELPLMMTLILRLARVPVALIARGEEYNYVTGRMSLRRRLTFRWTYKLAPYVLYRELYMEPLLKEFGTRKAWFLANAVDLPDHVREHSAPRCHFLFLNSIKHFRHPEVALEAFLQLCDELHLAPDGPVRLTIVGLQERSATALDAGKQTRLREMVEGRNVPVELHPWSAEPDRWLDDADVFLLPADVVFLNFSLLEAMARGIPAIVQDAPGAERVVTHGENGYVLPLDVAAWKKHMLRLIHDTTLRTRLGRAARQTVADRYSREAYAEQYDAVYREILGR